MVCHPPMASAPVATPLRRQEHGKVCGGASRRKPGSLPPWLGIRDAVTLCVRAGCRRVFQRRLNRSHELRCDLRGSAFSAAIRKIAEEVVVMVQDDGGKRFRG